MLADMGGVITPDEARTLILKKHYDLIASQMHRYVDAERRTLIAGFENIANKYALSAQAIEQSREQSLNTLNSFLSKLGYLK